MSDISNQKALDLLQSLGETSDDVASSLKSQGIKGDRQEDRYCPLAVFLKKNGCINPVVDIQFLYQMSSREDTNPTVCELPAACQIFVKRFDNGEFPDLEDETSDSE